MKKTLNIDAELLARAREACGAATDTAAVQAGLQELVRHAAYQRMRTLLGTEPDAQDVPRRREPAAEKRSKAHRAGR